MKMNRRNFVSKALKSLLLIVSGFGLGKLINGKKEEKGKSITVKEFRSLISSASPDRKTAYGRFAINEKVQKMMCENLKVGDKVFFFEIGPDLKHPDVKTNVVLTQATVV